MNRLFANREKILLRQLATGNERAFEKLFHIWKDKLYFFILRIVNTPENAEDIVQEIFTKLWQDRDKLIQIEHFSAYLFQMAKNQAISGMRRMAHETLILSELKKNATVAGLPVDETFLQKQLQEKLQEIVNNLPSRQNEVYTLSREQGLKQDEIARRLGISISTVQNHMTEALRTIRRQLQDYFPIALFYWLF